MCGRYRLSGPIDIIRDIQPAVGGPLGAVSDEARDILARDVILRPYNDVPVIFAGRDGELRMSMMYWQLIHYWCERFESRCTNFNTRLESLGKKHNLELLKRRRCLFPATSFIETRKDPEGRTVRPREAYEFSLKEGGLMMLGGIYTLWRNPRDSGERRASCSIITMEPNMIVGEIHPRMPFVVPAEDCLAWLDPGIDDAGAVMDLVRPMDSEKLTRKKEAREAGRRP